MLAMNRLISDLPFNQYCGLVASVLDRFLLLAVTRGTSYAVTELKSSRLCFTRWLSGKPLSGSVGCPITKDGLPKSIPKEVRYLLKLRRSDSLIKIIITLLSFSRIVKGGSEISLESITGPSLQREGAISDIEIISGLKRLGVSLNDKRPGTDKPFSWITTSGPNGPSITTSLSDRELFFKTFQEEVRVLLPSLTSIIRTLGDWEEKAGITKLLNLEYPSKLLRKLGLKEDREMKMRPFAIFDYWSQTVLTPIHDHLYRILSRIERDCTFDQMKGVRLMRQSQSKKWFYSYDLKSATDRFPVAFQERVMRLMFDEEYARAWRSIMTRLPFNLKSDLIEFKSGQPLGAKSSWAMFTLCHHLVVTIAGIRDNTPDPEYVILGDDIVLKGASLANKYRRIMADLGVDISESKSHVSKDTFEFAKVWIHKGSNVSGFPLVGMIETMEKPIELASLFVFELPSKGYYLHLSPCSLSGSLDWLPSIYTDPDRLALYKANLVCWYISVLSWLKTGSGDWAKYMAQMAGSSLSPARASDLITKIVKDEWLKLVKKGLGDLKSFAWELAKRIPSKLAFIEEDDDDLMIIGSSKPNCLQLEEHLLNIPILASLVKESEIEYESLLGPKLDQGYTLSAEELKKLKIPPSAQLKGFQPLRAKTNVRAVSALTRNIKLQVRALQPKTS